MAPLRQTLSPTANLLRNSRLFSLPTPLPRPNVAEARGAGVVKASDTATLPYPTHQAIVTTKSSLARGDWGLKRPLPSRSHLIQVSDPVLRMTQLDTIEHVTDFDSASDHVRTRQKWEEMGVPMMKGMAQMRGYDLSGPAPMGAFELRDDTTSYDTPLGMDEAGLYLHALKESSKRNSKKATQFQPFSPPPMDAAVHNAKRWKHDGPWLPGMTAEEFTTYLSREIHTRRAEFNTYLREFVKNEIYATRQLAASKAGETVPMDVTEAEAWQREKASQWSRISDEDIAASIKALRRETVNNPLTSKLVTKLILPFLRLPSMKFKYTAFSEDASSRDIDQYQFDQESAPLSTHPSAGLGYLRTKAYLSNHPILGPQSSQTPVSARVVQPRTTSTSKESYARLGVAGFVANDQFRSTDTTSSSRVGTNARDVETIDIDTPGGKKIMVQPMFGSVTNDGRIHMKLKRSSGAEVQVARGELEDRPPVREGFDADPLKDLRSLTGRASGKGRAASGPRSGMKGVEDSAAFKELSAESDRAKQLSSFLDQMTPEGKGKPAPGFPGVADALRESKT